MLGPKISHSIIHSVPLVFLQDEDDIETHEGYSPIKKQREIDVDSNKKNDLNTQDVEQQIKVVIEMKEPVKQIVEVQKTPEELRLEEYEKRVRESLALSKKALEQGKWKKCDQKGALIGYKLENDDDDGITTKSEGIIEGPTQYIYELLNNTHKIEKAKVFSSFQKNSTVLEQFEKNSIKILFSESAPPMISDRYSILVSGQIIEEGVQYNSIISIDLPNHLKIDPKKAVLSSVNYQTWILKPINENKMDVCLVSSVKVGGSMPGFIKNKVRNNRGLEQVKLLKEYVDNQIKKNKKK